MFNRDCICPKGPEEKMHAEPCKGYKKKVEGQEGLVLSCDCPLCSKYKSYLRQEHSLIV